MHNFFIGIMSGTSADSLDGCIVSFENEFKLIETETVDFGKNYKKVYEECIKSGYKVISDSNKLLQIEKILDEKSIELVEKLINKSGIEKNSVSKFSIIISKFFETLLNLKYIPSILFVLNSSKFKKFSLSEPDYHIIR